MTDYSLTTKKNWLQTKIELETEFRRWGVTDYVISPSSQKSVSVRYIVNGREVTLTYDKQARPQDNLRVIYLTINSLRLNDLRGISSLVESNYLQLSAPVIEKDPYDVLGLPRGTAPAVCEAQFKELAKRNHPDVPGGSAEKMQELTKAIEQIREQTF